MGRGDRGAAPSRLSAALFAAFALGSPALGQSARDLERRDGRIQAPAVTEYLQRIENRLAAAAGRKPLEIRLTRSARLYAAVTGAAQYLSAGLAKRPGNEMELAGLLAHQLAHRQGATSPPCVLSPFPAPEGTERRREEEQRASRQALTFLKAAGYDPAGLLDLFSKLAYEHPAWAQAIVVEDLLSLRSAIEIEEPPPAGYRVNTSEFVEQRDNLLAILGERGSVRLKP